MILNCFLSKYGRELPVFKIWAVAASVLGQAVPKLLKTSYK